MAERRTLDEIAHEATQLINDLFAQSHQSVAQRTARVHLVVRAAMREFVGAPADG